MHNCIPVSRFAQDHEGDARYCHELRRWFLWDGRRPAPDRTSAVLALAADSIQTQLREPQALADDERTAVLHRLRLMEHPARLRAMLSVARTRDPIATVRDALDTDPWLLNLLNGTFDLRENRLRDRSKAHLITRLLPVAYKPKAACPALQRFVQRVVPDEGVCSFLQRAGCCLIGDTSVRRGRNGKSQFPDTLRRLLADYGARTPGATLLPARNHRPACSKLHLEIRGWCEHACLTPPTLREFGLQLTLRGFPADKISGAMWRRGIAVHFDVLENA